MSNYRLEYINDTPYLVPFGQVLSCGAKAVRLNSTSAVMWNRLIETHFIDILTEPAGSTSKSAYEKLENIWLDSICEHFDSEHEPERTLIKNDALAFINMLSSRNIFSPLTFNNIINKDLYKKNFSIGGIDMSYCGPSDMYPDEFDSFTNNHSGKSMVNITVSGCIDRSYELNELILRTRDVCIFKNDNGFFLMFNTFKVIKECELSTDGTVSLYYYIPSLDERKKTLTALLDETDYDTGRYETFHAIRFAYLFFAQRIGIFALHSASILYKDKLWLISAPSGTGKSTHASVWNRVYGTPVINGDLNCIDISDSHISVKGSPWCGTSGIFSSKTFPLGGIILISQGKDNIAVKQSNEADMCISVLNRLISPSWNEEMLSCNINAARKICANALVFSLSCDMSDDAAKVCKEFIDEHM